MRRRLTLAAVLAVLVAAPNAAAQGPVIQAVDGTPDQNYENFGWTPKAVSIKVGETVTWSFTGTEAPHNVASRGTNWSLPGAAPVRTPSPVTHTFATPGVYEFVCQVHLPSMVGTVTVTDASGTPPPPPPPPPLSEQHWANDQQPPPTVERTDERRPRLSRVRVRSVRNGARVRFRLSERARVRVSFELAGITVKTKRRMFRPGRRSLIVRDRRMRGRYRIEVVARDLAGNRSRVKRASVTVR